MSKWRKKPVVIETVQLLWSTWVEMCDFAGVGNLDDGKPDGRHLEGDCIGLAIPTLEGLKIAEEGDWISKGVKGELYPCKPDIFAETYEGAEMSNWRFDWRSYLLGIGTVIGLIVLWAIAVML